MRATALNGADEHHPTLDMETEVGRLRGTWRDQAAIKAGESVDVELEIPRPRAGTELPIDLLPSQSLQVLHGVVSSVFEDGVVVLQIGSAALQIETDGHVPKRWTVGAPIVLSADDLEFHPTGL